MNKFTELKQYTDTIGYVYGTENIAIYLYSLAKMIEPEVVVDLGTGLGSTSLWLGMALKENGKGKVITIDDGSEWYRIRQIQRSLEPYYSNDYSKFVENLISEFELKSQVSFVKTKIETLEISPEIDILVSDHAHNTYNILKIFAKYLPKMSMNSYIFIDSASTLYSSYHTLEKLIDQFNQGIIPFTLREMIADTDAEYFSKIVQCSTFKLTHLIENKKRNQNSTAQIQISPIDIMPQPRVNIRF